MRRTSQPGRHGSAATAQRPSLPSTASGSPTVACASCCRSPRRTSHPPARNAAVASMPALPARHGPRCVYTFPATGLGDLAGVDIDGSLGLGPRATALPRKTTPLASPPPIEPLKRMDVLLQHRRKSPTPDHARFRQTMRAPPHPHRRRHPTQRAQRCPKEPIPWQGSSTSTGSSRPRAPRT